MWQNEDEGSLHERRMVPSSLLFFSSLLITFLQVQLGRAKALKGNSALRSTGGIWTLLCLLLLFSFQGRIHSNTRGVQAAYNPRGTVTSKGSGANEIHKVASMEYKRCVSLSCFLSAFYHSRDKLQWNTLLVQNGQQNGGPMMGSRRR
jgi:hypothetical protein